MEAEGVGGVNLYWEMAQDHAPSFEHALSKLEN